MQPHHSPVVRAERPHRVCQDLLQGQQDLLIEATDKVPVSPAEAACSQRVQVTAHERTAPAQRWGSERGPGETARGLQQKDQVLGLLSPACSIPVHHSTLSRKLPGKRLPTSQHPASKAKWNPISSPNPLSSAAVPPFTQLEAQWLPEDVAEKEGSTVPQSPVVIQGVDGGSQGLQDAVEDTAHQRADIGPQAEVWVPNQAPGHLQEPVQLLQIVAHGLHLLVEEDR